MTISLEKFTELAHRTASRYSHRSEPEKVAYTFLPHTLEDFHRQVCAEAEAAVKQARIDALEEAAAICQANASMCSAGVMKMTLEANADAIESLKGKTP